MKKLLTNFFVFAIVSSVLLATLPVSAVAEQATASLNKKQVHALGGNCEDASRASHTRGVLPAASTDV